MPTLIILQIATQHQSPAKHQRRLRPVQAKIGEGCIHGAPLPRMFRDVSTCLDMFPGLMAGWWFSHPSEKYESVGMISNPIYGKIELMFQTTNQMVPRIDGHQGVKVMPSKDPRLRASILTILRAARDVALRCKPKGLVRVFHAVGWIFALHGITHLRLNWTGDDG